MGCAAFPISKGPQEDWPRFNRSTSVDMSHWTAFTYRTASRQDISDRKRNQDSCYRDVQNHERQKNRERFSTTFNYRKEDHRIKLHGGRFIEKSGANSSRYIQFSSYTQWKYLLQDTAAKKVSQTQVSGYWNSILGNIMTGSFHFILFHSSPLLTSTRDLMLG